MVMMIGEKKVSANIRLRCGQGDGKSWSLAWDNNKEITVSS